MKPQKGGELGLHVDNMVGILDLYWNITDVIRYTSQTPGENDLQKQLNFPPTNSRYHFLPSAQDLATQAAADLTYALLHPQPAGPFCKVGDEQTIAFA
jgi:hypothetical protein